MLGLFQLVFFNLTEIGALWQVPANKAVHMLVCTSLPRRIGPRKVAFHAELCGDLFMFGILGAIVYGQSSSSLSWKLLETPNDRLRGLRSAFPVELRDQ